MVGDRHRGRSDAVGCGDPRSNGLHVHRRDASGLRPVHGDLPDGHLRPARRLAAARRRCGLGDSGDPGRRTRRRVHLRGGAELGGVARLHQLHRLDLRCHAAHSTCVPARISGRLPVHIRTDRVPHRCRRTGRHRPAARHAGDRQGFRLMAGAAMACDHVARRHQLGFVRVYRRHLGHHPGIQALRPTYPRGGRRGRADDHRVRSDGRLLAWRGRRRVRERRLPDDRSPGGN